MLGFSPIAATPLAAAGTSVTIVLSATEAKDIASFIADGGYNVYMAAIEAPDIVAFNAVIDTPLYLQAIDNPDSASVTLWNTNINVLATEAQDVANLLAEMTGTVLMAATEGPDGYSQNAYILWLTPTQPDDPSIWVPKNDPTPYLTTVI